MPRAAQRKRPPLSVEALWSMYRVGSPTLSPDGPWACAPVTAFDMEKNEGSTSLWLFASTARGGSTRGKRLTAGDKDSAPAWSPDGRHVAFTAKRKDDAEPQVYLIAPYGGEARRLTTLATGASAIKWFADGRRIAFVSWVWPELRGDAAQKKRIDARKADPVKAFVTERAEYRYWDHWLADGREPHLFVVDVASGACRDVLAGTGLRLRPWEPAPVEYDVAPDGSEIALTFDPNPEPGMTHRADLVVLNLRTRTKAQVLEYYRRMAEFILPHLKDRALTLKRYPEGVKKDSFFEKRYPFHHPEWVITAEIRLGEGEPMTVCLVNNLETLMWVANLASLELHVPLARVSSPETPDSMVFDLDPGDEADIVDCARVALILKDLLLDLGLLSCAKTSGKKGLHVYVPLNRKETAFEDTTRFSKAVAEIMQESYPDLVTARMAKEYRKAKVFINWSQNDASKTMICVYSLRAREKPTVSFPLEWRELENPAGLGPPERLQVTHSEALSRAEEKGDLF